MEAGQTVPFATLRALLDLTVKMHQCRSVVELQMCLTQHVSSVVWADLVTLNSIDITGNMGGSIGMFCPEFISPREIEPHFDRWVHQHPLVQDMRETGDGAPRRMSDYISVDEFKKLELYEYVFKPLRSLHQVGFLVNSVPGLIVGIGVNRTSEDFTDDELAMMRLVYEQLPTAFHHVQLTEVHAREKALPIDVTLTDREREILIYLRAGLSNQEIATSLIVGKRTIEKHLENLYAKLGVKNRTAAVNSVWPAQAD